MLILHETIARKIIMKNVQTITNKILATDEVVFNLYVAKYRMTVQLITGLFNCQVVYTYIVMVNLEEMATQNKLITKKTLTSAGAVEITSNIERKIKQVS